ncbi:MAG: hypothetical protein KAJ24_02160 [Candidatus Aenigmarchaeota archaeon]|nr:hypothetical protein [Candidatus Aenigmarchaeota archaeon]
MISSTKSLDALFNEIGKELNDKITMYVFGGAALMFSGLKNATKDIDIVFETRRELKLFIDALKRQGFDTTKITEEYKHLKLQGIYTRKNDRFDVFLKIICNNLALSKGMIFRSKKKGSYGNLVVNILSFEDIFLLKSIFSRAGDYEDCVALFQAGINWDMIYDEVNDQCKKNTANVWKSYLVARIEEMQEREHIRVPIFNKLRKESEEETYIPLAVFLELSKENMSFEELLEKTELEKSLLKTTIKLLLNDNKIEEKQNEKYQLKARNIFRFLSRT